MAPQSAHVSQAAPGPEPRPAVWDAFVQATDGSSHLQLSPWATVKAANGWRAIRLAIELSPGPIGAQVLVRRPSAFPWTLAYAPRGPLTANWSAGAIEAFTEHVKTRLPGTVGRISHLRVDPQVEADGPHDQDGALRSALRRSGWRPAPSVQMPSTRLIDLRADEGALWADLRKKWRQYVHRATARGVRVIEGDVAMLPDFYRIYRETASRAGFVIRAERTFRDVWAAFHPLGLVSLLFAVSSGGDPVATLFLLRCGARVAEPYGGMTLAGAESRANYLLKWEAIRRARESGAATYDMWGQSHAGIAYFKAGFGGREVRYVGAWDLVFDDVGRTAYGVAQSARVWLARARHGLRPTTRLGAADVGEREE